MLCATTACTCSISQLPKKFRDGPIFTLFTSWCSSWHNRVQVFISHLPSCLCTRRFSEPTFRPSGATNHWKKHCFAIFLPFRAHASSLFWLSPSLIFSISDLLSSDFLLAVLVHLSVLSEFWLLNFHSKLTCYMSLYASSQVPSRCSRFPSPQDSAHAACLLMISITAFFLLFGLAARLAGVRLRLGRRRCSGHTGARWGSSDEPRHATSSHCTTAPPRKRSAPASAYVKSSGQWIRICSNCSTAYMWQQSLWWQNIQQLGRSLASAGEWARMQTTMQWSIHCQAACPNAVCTWLPQAHLVVSSKLRWPADAAAGDQRWWSLDRQARTREAGRHLEHELDDRWPESVEAHCESC